MIYYQPQFLKNQKAYFHAQYRMKLDALYWPSSPLINWNDIQIINEGVNLKYHGQTNKKKSARETTYS